MSSVMHIMRENGDCGIYNGLVAEHKVQVPTHIFYICAATSHLKEENVITVT